MRSTIFVAALTAPSVLAFPWLKPEGLEALLSHPEAQHEIKRRFEGLEDAKSGLDSRQLNTGLLNGATTLLGGTLKAVLDPVLGLIPTNDAVKGLKKFPEGAFVYIPCLARYILTCIANYPFKAPGPTDQRGPCPGLNTLANHGCMAASASRCH
jgi:hypothetical protein